MPIQVKHTYPIDIDLNIPPVTDLDTPDITDVMIVVFRESPSSGGGNLLEISHTFRLNLETSYPDLYWDGVRFLAGDFRYFKEIHSMIANNKHLIYS